MPDIADLARLVRKSEEQGSRQTRMKPSIAASGNLQEDAFSLQRGQFPWPEGPGNPVLDSIAVVIERSRDVRTHIDRIRDVAGWMAYEDLPIPDYSLPLAEGENDPEW